MEEHSKRWDINVSGTANSTFLKEYILSNQVFLVKRQCRYSKMNAFTQLVIVEIQRESDITYSDHFYVLYRWTETELKKENRNFFISRHGYSQKPFSGTILIFC